MPLQVYTARLPHHGCPGYIGRDRLDITRGSGGAEGSIFAPSNALLSEAQKRKRAAKRDEDELQAAWSWYVPQYIEEMRVSYRNHREAWKALLARSEITLCCYCAGVTGHCHRRLLAEILVRCGAVDCGERQP